MRPQPTQAPVTPRNYPAFDQPTTPMLPARRRSDHKLLVVAGLGGLILITAPIVAFSQTGNSDEAVTNGVSSTSGVVESQSPQPIVVSPLPGGPVAVDNARRLTLLARGQDNTVLRNSTPSSSGDSSSGWTNLGGNAAGAPVGVRDGHGELAAFFIGTDGNLWYKPQAAQAQAASKQWTDLKGGQHLVGTPAVVPDAQGKLVVAARAVDGTVHVIQQTELGVDSWSEWRPLQAVATGDLAIYRDAQGELRIFGIGPDKKLWEAAQARLGANEWTPPTSLGGVFTGPPSVAMDVKGRLRVFALGPDGSLQVNIETGAGSRKWSGWQNMGHRLVGKLVVVTDARDTVVIYGLNENGALQEVWGDLPRVESANHGGNIAELVGAAQDATGRIFVYGIGKKGDMEVAQQMFPASGPWSDWSAELGGVFIPAGG